MHAALEGPTASMVNTLFQQQHSVVHVGLSQLMPKITGDDQHHML